MMAGHSSQYLNPGTEGSEQQTGEGGDTQEEQGTPAQAKSLKCDE